MEKILVLLGSKNGIVYYYNGEKKLVASDNYYVDSLKTAALLLENAVDGATLYAPDCVCRKATFLKSREAQGKRFLHKDYIFSDSSEEYKAAVGAFCTAYRKALKRGISIKNVFLIDEAILNVPEGIVLSDGQKISFYQGKTFNGITVPSWPTFNRNLIKVKVRTGYGKPLYTISLGLKKNAPLKGLIAEMWAMLPKAEVVAA